MLYPNRSITHDFSYVEHHPIAEAYRAFCEEVNANQPAKLTCPHDHHTADLPAVLYAARPDRGYFLLSNPGTVTVLADGSSRFVESAEGTHRYLIVTDEQKARTLEAMVMLASQPPARIVRFFHDMYVPNLASPDALQPADRLRSRHTTLLIDAHQLTIPKRLQLAV